MLVNIQIVIGFVKGINWKRYKGTFWGIIFSRWGHIHLRSAHFTVGKL